MYLAYSALRTPADATENTCDASPEPPQTEVQIRHRAYLEVCRKYGCFITEIQRYLPGWMPEFK